MLQMVPQAKFPRKRILVLNFPHTKFIEECVCSNICEEGRDAGLGRGRSWAMIQQLGRLSPPHWSWRAGMALCYSTLGSEGFSSPSSQYLPVVVCGWLLGKEGKLGRSSLCCREIPKFHLGQEPWLPGVGRWVSPTLGLPGQLTTATTTDGCKAGPHPPGLTTIFHKMGSAWVWLVNLFVINPHTCTLYHYLVFSFYSLRNQLAHKNILVFWICLEDNIVLGECACTNAPKKLFMSWSHLRGNKLHVAVGYPFQKCHVNQAGVSQMQHWDRKKWRVMSKVYRGLSAGFEPSLGIVHYST